MSDKQVSKRILFKTSFWYTLSMFLTRGIGFITMPIFTRIMTKEAYGDFSVFCSWQSIFLIICSLELYATLNRARFDFPEKKDLDSYITSCLFLCTLLTGIVFVLYLIFPHIFDRLILLDRKYMLVMFAYLFVVPALNMFQAKQRIEYKYKTSSAISISVALLSPLIAVVLVLTMRDTDPLFGRIFGQFVLYILFGIIFYIYFIHNSRRIQFNNFKYAFQMGLPLVFSYLGSRILLTADSIVLKHMCSADEVSYLSVTQSTSHIMLILVQTLNIAWAPWFYDMLKEKRYEEIKKTYKMYLWGIILCTFGVLLIGPEVINVLGGSKYSESVYILPANILCGIFTALSAQFVNLETYHKKPIYAGVLTAGIAVLNVLMDILGVKLWGYRAVCYATVICQVLLIALHFFVTRPMNIKEILPLRSLVIALAATLILIPISLILYQRNIVRYIVFGAIAAIVLFVLVIKRNEIIQLLQRFKKRKKEA